MRFKGSRFRTTFIIGVVVIALFATSNASASPLYGGFNGNSKVWAEYYYDEPRIGFSLRFSVGADTDFNWWVRVGLSFIPYIYNVGLSYESDNVLSLNFATILPWPVSLGIDTNRLWWYIINVLFGVVGRDSDANMWGETWWLFPGLYAFGVDNNDNRWQCLRLFSVLVGVGEELFEENEISFNQKNSVKFEEEMRSLEVYFQEERGSKISALLVERLADDEIVENIRNLSEALNDRRALLPLTTFSINENGEGITPFDSLNVTPPELNVLLTYVEEKVFTDEIRDEIGVLLDSFAKDIQPHLKAIEKMVVTPP
jgi:hypothetical protein